MRHQAVQTVVLGIVSRAGAVLGLGEVLPSSLHLDKSQKTENSLCSNAESNSGDRALFEPYVARWLWSRKNGSCLSSLPAFLLGSVTSANSASIVISGAATVRHLLQTWVYATYIPSSAITTPRMVEGSWTHFEKGHEEGDHAGRRGTMPIGVNV
jgi:hypothetical protein